MPMVEPKKQLLLTMPNGVSERDVTGLLMGFSKAADKDPFRTAAVEGAYTELDGMMLVPTGDIISVESKSGIGAGNSFCILQIRCSPRQAASLARKMGI